MVKLWQVLEGNVNCWVLHVSSCLKVYFQGNSNYNNFPGYLLLGKTGSSSLSGLCHWPGLGKWNGFGVQGPLWGSV